jgi:hypothetical protein
MAEPLNPRQQLEQSIVKIIQCLGALCDTHLALYTDTDAIGTCEAASDKLDIGYEVSPVSKHLQFDLNFINTESTRITHHEFDQYCAYLGVRLSLPDVIENILRSVYKNQLFPDVTFAVTGHATLRLEQVDHGMLCGVLRKDFIDFEFDSMTDTMLRHAYPKVLRDLEPLMPWLEFSCFLLEQNYNYEHLKHMQLEFAKIMKQALISPQLHHPHVFKLCELAGSFDPALRLFRKRYPALFH